MASQTNGVEMGPEMLLVPIPSACKTTSQSSELGVLVLENGLIGNYDPIQSELADNVTLQAQRGSFRIARNPSWIDVKRGDPPSQK